MNTSNICQNLSARPRPSSALLGLTLLGLANAAAAVSETDQWQREFDLSQTAKLIVHNVSGSVTVTGYDGDAVIVNATEKRSARSDEMLEKSRDLIYLEIEQSADELILDVTGPEHRRGRNHCRGCELKIEFDIQVPRATELEVATVNDGKINIADVAGPINANHVNGSVVVTGARHCSEISSVNGRLDFEFITAPVEDCEFNTVNGDITVALPTDANASLSFDLFNGKARSDFEVEPRALPATVERDTDHGGTRYRIRKAAGVQLGSGGPTLEFESINGDVSIERTDKRTPR